MVLLESEADSWTAENTEDKLDDLDTVVRQVTRDNQDAVSGINLLRFDGAFSRTGYVIYSGNMYRFEEYRLIGELHAGS